MSNYETTQIGCYVIQTAREKQWRCRHENNITFKQICDKFNASLEFIKVNSKVIAQWLKERIDVIDVDIYDDMFDIIVK